MFAMAQASDYRKRADECTELSQTARTPSQRTMLLHIADTWLRLARDAENNEQGGRMTWAVPPATKLM
jgi:hypothetical protein